MTLSAGDRVDRYEIVEFLGSGGMGEVYRARDPKLQRQIALKILRADGSIPTDGRARLLREARAVAALSHPNVLAVFDVGELNGLSFIAMELVVGHALRAHMGEASVSMDRRLTWLADIARALAAAHEAGIVHRDVKPENVMVRVDGMVKVLDFGVARSIRGISPLSSTEGHSLSTLGTGDLAPPMGVDALASTASTRPGALTGTLYYMAPEQLRGEPIDGRADQFAWGAVAYELLTGRPPWVRGPDPIAIVSQILSHVPRPAADVEPRIPRAASDAIARALSKEPSARFPSMEELLATLAQREVAATGDQGIVPAITGTATARRLPSSRARVGWLGASALAALALASLAVSRTQGRAPSGAASPPLPAVAAGGCTSSAACVRAHGGAAWRCQSARHECVELGSVDCTTLAQPSDLANDQTVWIGALYPTTGPEAVDFAPEARALDLARQDFAAAFDTTSGGSTATRARPIGLVMCDETVDPVRAATHLARDVEVPAVVGFRSARTARAIIPSVLLPARIDSMIAISQSPDLTRIPEPPGEPRLVWRSTLNANDTVGPLAALVADVLEPRMRAARGAPLDAPIRVAAVRRGGAFDVADEIFRALRFNGKSALENGDDFRQYVVDEATGAGADETTQALLAFRPQIIFVMGTAFTTKVLEPLEKAWGRGSGRGPRPLYVTDSGDFADVVPAWAGKDAERRHRFFGVTNLSSRMTNAQLVLRYNLSFPSEPVTRTVAPQPSYDAFYVLAYAALALADEPITGPALSRAMGRLRPPGRKVDVGPRGIFEAFTALRAGEQLDLDGALGSLDFDPATGEAPIDYAIVCLGVDDHGVASSSLESGLVYDATSRKLTGAMHCP